MEYNTPIKNEENLYELICSDFQNIFISEKSKVQRIPRVWYLLFNKEGAIRKYLGICLFEGRITRKNAYLSLFNGLLIKLLKPKGFNDIKFRHQVYILLGSFRYNKSIGNFSYQFLINYVI